MQSLLNGDNHFRLLSELVLAPKSQESSNRIRELSRNMTSDEFRSLADLSAKNHVLVRALKSYREMLPPESESVATMTDTVLSEENQRIDHALDFLRNICATMEKCGCPVTVIKSLDHWPDLGSDLDLYTDAEAADVVQAMRTAFEARVDDRSWGDRLANKWNFVVPGLPESRQP